MHHPLVSDSRSTNEPSVDAARLLAFENQFDPAHPAASRLRVLGHGRFSTVFEIEGMEGVALKRLPPFPTVNARALYERSLNAYHMLLRDTVGLPVVDQRCVLLTNAAGEHVLYVAQARQPDESMGDRVLARCTEEEAIAALATVLRHTLRVWYRNAIEKELDVPGSQTGLDARLTNWSIALADGRVAGVRYLDTGTPFFRRLDKDHLEPDLFLSGAAFPGLVRQHYVHDVLTRYYDLRLVLIDLLAGFYDIDQAARLPLAIKVVNHLLTTEAADLYIEPIEAAEVERYARADTRYWKKFLQLSRFKRFTSTRLFRNKYHFVLPT